MTRRKTIHSEIKLNEAETDLLLQFKDIESLYKGTKLEFDALIKKKLIEASREINLKLVDKGGEPNNIVLDMGDGFISHYSPPRRYFKFKKPFVLESLVFEHPEMFESKIGYERVTIKEDDSDNAPE